jgi:large subunit ribosomal protein L24
MGVFRRGFTRMFDRNKWKILRGDTVVVTAGKDRGQRGVVLRVVRDDRFPRVVVEGLNLSKRAIKRTKDSPGGIVSVESPLHYSNVALLDPVTAVPVRAAWRYLEDGSKVRVTRGRGASGSVVARPAVLAQRRKPRPAAAGPADTPAVVAAEATHVRGALPSALTQFMQRRSAATSALGGGGGGGAIGAIGAISAAALVAARRAGARRPLGTGRGFAAGAL